MLHFGKQGLSIAATAAVSAAVKASDELHDRVGVCALMCTLALVTGCLCVNVSGVFMDVHISWPLFTLLGFGYTSYAL